MKKRESSYKYIPVDFLTDLIRKDNSPAVVLLACSVILFGAILCGVFDCLRLLYYAISVDY